MPNSAFYPQPNRQSQQRNLPNKVDVPLRSLFQQMQFVQAYHYWLLGCLTSRDGLVLVQLP